MSGYIAIEEAVAVPGLDDRRPPIPLPVNVKPRFDSRYATLAVSSPLRRAPSEYFGDNVLVTTSGVLSTAAVEALITVIGADAVLFAIDYPYESTRAAVAALERAGISQTEKDKIAFGNARDLLHI